MRLIPWVVVIVLLAAYAWLVVVPGAGSNLADLGSRGAQTAPGQVVAPEDVYNPVHEGEETPAGYRQLLGRDAIYPVYNPTFQPGDETDWDGEALVIGVALDGEAKAYPVSFLSYREMVNDSIGDTPILVTW